MFIPAPTSSYNEVYQDTDIKYAFAVCVDGGLKQVHDFVKCRDFFNEAVVSCQIGCPSPRIYGFQYPSIEYPLNLNLTQMILKGDKLKQLVSQIEILNRYEEDAGYAQTCLEPIEGTDFLYLKADKVWLRSTVMVSLYTHILRCLYQYESNTGDFIEFLTSCAESDGNAASYQREINRIDLDLLIRRAAEVFPDGCLPLEGMKDIPDVSRIHHNCGIVSWSAAVQGDDLMGDYYAKSLETFKKLAA